MVAFDDGMGMPDAGWGRLVELMEGNGIPEAGREVMVEFTERVGNTPEAEGRPELGRYDEL